MPKITSTPPQYIKDELKALRLELDAAISKRTADNVLIATWNIRSFGRLTEKWVARNNLPAVRML